MTQLASYVIFKIYFLFLTHSKYVTIVNIFAKSGD